MSSSGEPGNPREPRGELWIDRWILPALRDLALLPIVLAVVGHVIAFAVPTLIFALRDRRIDAQMAVFALFALSFAGVRFEFHWARTCRDVTTDRRWPARLLRPGDTSPATPRGTGAPELRGRTGSARVGLSAARLLCRREGPGPGSGRDCATLCGGN